jgi:Mlc titration factor MtfA (ptsG expression regulator)
VSVLVHEMVHHLQNMAGTTYGCPAAREKLAYAAQQKWLAQAGQDFFEAFETDPMTLLVRTSCGF